MEYRSMRHEDVESLVSLWNCEMGKLGYKPFRGSRDFEEAVVKHPDFDANGCMVALDEEDRLAGFVCGICQKEFLPGEGRENTPGYISMLVVRSDYRNRGVGSRLLAMAEEYLYEQGKEEIRFSHKCPMKFSWFVNQEGKEHNKAPGVKTDSYGFRFLLDRGYETVQEEVSYYRSLGDFVIPPDVLARIQKLEEQGIRVTYFEEEKHHGFDGMFTRLNDESFRKKFMNGIRRGAHLLIASDGNGNVCATAGELYNEDNGRGFFSALAVDPEYSGRHIGSCLFFVLCQELKEMGAEYMTIFVTKTNFARKIYEKAGFAVVQEWAIMRKRKRGREG